MLRPLKHIVVVGGGTAGWLTASTIAAEFSNRERGIRITLVESDQTGPIGVGEGTWPSMRSTLKKIGITETTFFRECQASFKQGSTFRGWLHGGDEQYHHPFTLPVGYQEINLADYWPPYRDQISFADAVCPQVAVCERDLAPRQRSAPDYAGTLNYGYHLDATQFAKLLQRHATDNLGVKHIMDHVVGINGDPQGDITSIQTRDRGAIEGDLFIDCTGFASLLIGKHYQIPHVEQSHVLFNDRAIAAQVPRTDLQSPIASTTLATAQHAGWIWDIGLPTRRGTGHVFSSRHTDEDDARQALVAYITRTTPGLSAEEISMRVINIQPGYREKFWHRNCVAVGLSGGFVEPLEASALVLVELAARTLAEQMPIDRGTMDITARRFNDNFVYRWQHIIHFLKLHYVLSKRSDSQYWRDHRSSASIPDELAEQLEIWRHRSPWFKDETRVDEMFPSASYQYVLYGMEFDSSSHSMRRRMAELEQKRAQELFNSNKQKIDSLVANLPSNRDLIAHIQSSTTGSD